jgi:hypothetical protein
VGLQTARDYSATSLIGPMSTPSQDINSELVNALYHFWAPLNKAALDYPQAVRQIVSPSIEVSFSEVSLRRAQLPTLQIDLLKMAGLILRRAENPQGLYRHRRSPSHGAPSRVLVHHLKDP